MRPQRIYTTEAVILRVRRLGEADSILTLLSADRGKFDAVARGVRKPTSRKAGHVEPLTHSTLLLAHGSNLDIITQAQALHTFLPMRESLRRLGAGLYVAELTDRFTVEREEEYAVFRLLVDTLARLSDEEDIDLTLRYFEARLLQEAGFRPQLYQCVSCGEALKPIVNYFSVAGGGAVCPNCRPAGSGLPPIGVNTLKVLRLMLRAGYDDVARLRLDESLMAETESLLRLAVHRQLEREPRSLQFLRELRRPYLAGAIPSARAPVL
ncbi:MAG: DNA repair protein RecO [Dehalococcoidia bacterium]